MERASRRARRFAFVLALVCVGAVVVAATATAAPPSQTGRLAVTFASGTSPAGSPDTVDGVVLTQSGKTANGGTFDAGTPQLGVSPGTIVPMAGSGCGDAGVNWEAAYDIFGFTVWKIWNHTSFCWSNYRVTSVSGWTDVYTGIGWGVNSKNWYWQWYNPYAVARSIATAHFWTGYSGSPIQEAYPNVITYVNGNGYYWFG